MKKYFVYSGFVSSNNFDCSEGPTYGITVCETEYDVLELYKRFNESIHDQCSYVIFRVFHGEEKQLIAKTKVVEFDLV